MIIAMHRDEALKLLKGGPDGIKEWNRRRAAAENIPSLANANLKRAMLSGAHLQGADLSGADLRYADLTLTTLSDAQMASTSPAMFTKGIEPAVYKTVTQSVRSCRLGTDCYGYALLAAGLIDLVVEAHLKPYDIVALIPIVERAGGIVTDWNGGDARHGGRIVAAANPSLHSEALKIIADAAARTGSQ